MATPNANLNNRPDTPPLIDTQKEFEKLTDKGMQPPQQAKATLDVLSSFFAEVWRRIEERFASSEKRTDERFASVDKRFDDLRWVLGLIVFVVLGCTSFISAFMYYQAGQTDARFTRIEASVEANTARIEANGARIEANGARIEANGAKLDDLNAKFDAFMIEVRKLNESHD